ASFVKLPKGVIPLAAIMVISVITKGNSLSSLVSPLFLTLGFFVFALLFCGFFHDESAPFLSVLDLDSFFVSLNSGLHKLRSLYLFHEPLRILIEHSDNLTDTSKIANSPVDKPDKNFFPIRQA